MVEGSSHALRRLPRGRSLGAKLSDCSPFPYAAAFPAIALGTEAPGFEFGHQRLPRQPLQQPQLLPVWP